MFLALAFADSIHVSFELSLAAAVVAGVATLLGETSTAGIVQERVSRSFYVQLDVAHLCCHGINACIALREQERVIRTQNQRLEEAWKCCHWSIAAVALHEELSTSQQIHRQGPYALSARTGSRTTRFKHAGIWRFAGHVMIACSPRVNRDARYAEHKSQGAA